MFTTRHRRHPHKPFNRGRPDPDQATEAVLYRSRMADWLIWYAQEQHAAVPISVPESESSYIVSIGTLERQEPESRCDFNSFRSHCRLRF
jgi:hypothetical protein